MKILFLLNSLSVQGEPMGVMQLSAIAKSLGHETALAIKSPELLDVIASYSPDLLAVSMMSGEYPELKKTITRVRERFPHLHISAGGPHPTFASDVFESMPELDSICVGEGDTALPLMLERLENGESLHGIGNLLVPGGELIPARLVEDLDSLPFIDRELVYDASPMLERFTLRTFYSSRGCPFNCTYCFNHAFNSRFKGLGKIVRKRSVSNLLDEMEQVISRYPTEYVRFSDDAFVHRVDSWLEEFAREYPKRIGLPFYCLVRPNCVSQELVSLLKQAGCKSVGMSIESGNTHLRENVLRRNISDERMIQAFDMFNQAGIRIKTNNMLGLPGATIEDEIATLDLNIKCRPACSLFGVFVPYPGTELFRTSVDLDCIDADIDFETINEFTGMESMLYCFSEDEKRVHKNFFYLAPLVIYFPWLRDVFIKHLMWMKPNIFFGLIHTFFKYFIIKKEIVPVKLSIADYFRHGLSVLKNEMVQIKANYARRRQQ